MDIVNSVTALRERLQREPNNVFVPTMGNLHEGHIDLIRIGKPKAACTVVSIFVNRLQFGPKEDFERYPRTFQSDCDKLRSAGVDVVFAPDEKEIYPEPQTFAVEPSDLQHILDGAFRPGHFRGVATVVLKLFNMVMPHAAIFGKKDYQQYLVLRDMVRQFALPVEIIPAETVRAADGLALVFAQRLSLPGRARRGTAPVRAAQERARKHRQRRAQFPAHRARSHVAAVAKRLGAAVRLGAPPRGPAGARARGAGTGGARRPPTSARRGSSTTSKSPCSVGTHFCEDTDMNYRLTRAAALACMSLMLSACSSISLWPFGGDQERDTSRAPAGATAYQCDGSKHLFVRYLDNGAAAWVILPEREFRLNKASSGNSYSNGSDTLELSDQVATLSEGTSVTYANCKASGS